MRTPTTSNDFYEMVQRSQLIEAPKFNAFVQQLEDLQLDSNDPIECAQLMVFEGLITQFQAKLLLQGKYKNFFIGGKYKVLDHLGDGGMGSVYLCEHRFMRRRVAVKMLPAEKSADRVTVQRFMREAQAVARLNHPNIVRAHDIDNEGGVHFIVMEFVDGINLQQLVENNGPLSIERAVNYLAGACSGLNHAAQAGLVHRDIKPANLLLDRQGVLKILDLGLARFSQDTNSDLTMMNDQSVLGTADYLAPEQAIDASKTDIRADIYALGATTYFLLTGKPMFDGGTVAQKLIWHQTKQPKPLNFLRGEIPSELAAVVTKMVAKNPDDRFQTPAQVYHALTPWLKAVKPPHEDELPATRFASHADFDMSGRSNHGETIHNATNAQRATLAEFKLF